LRDPYKRIYSGYLDVSEGKNIPYRDPSGLDRVMGFKPNLSFSEFLEKVLAIPDYLADRHFRPQAFYYPTEILNAVNDSRILTISEFMDRKARGQNSDPSGKLNINKQNIPPELRESLENNERFNRKFKRDLALFNQASAQR
jgi:hypothetical protein